MREIVQGRPAVRARGARRRRSGLDAVRRPAVQASRSSGTSRRARPSEDAGEVGAATAPSASTATSRRRRSTRSSTCAAARTSRPPASSARSSSRRSRARTGAATRSARCSSASTAPRGSRQAALEEHLHRLEEAERRDHRKLGAELDLFSFPDEIGSGLAVFHPKGGTVRRIMEDYSRQRHEEAGYEFVNSPHITKAHLFETSGHLDWFADGMFPPMELDGRHATTTSSR